MSGDTQSLQGKFPLVIGASRGIGRGIALRLAERGAAVAVNFLQNEAAAADTVLDQIARRRSLRRAGQRCSFRSIGQPTAVRRS